MGKQTKRNKGDWGWAVEEITGARSLKRDHINRRKRKKMGMFPLITVEAAHLVMFKPVGTAMDFVSGAKGDLVQEVKGIINNGIDLLES